MNMIEIFFEIYNELSQEEAARSFTQAQKIQIAIAVLKMETTEAEFTAINETLEEISTQINRL